MPRLASGRLYAPFAPPGRGGRVRRPSADTAPSLTQKVSKELRGLAAKAGGDVVTVTFKGRRRKALVCARSELPALRDVIANVR